MAPSPETRAGRRLAAVLAVVAWTAGCAAPLARGPGGDPLFGRLAASGWQPVGPPRTFGPGTLYEEIDGEAELFLPFDFRELTVGILSPRGRAAAEVRLEVFRLGSARDAFGVYSQHRFPGQEIARAGPSEAIVSDASLDFFRGDRFVRIRAGSPAAGRADLLKLGEDAARSLSGPIAPPPEADALGIPGVEAGTLVFHRRAILGYEGLAPGYEAKITADGLAATIVLVPPADPPVPTAALLTGMTEVAGAGPGRFRAALRSGTLWVAERGGYRFGVAGALPPPLADAVLARIGGRLDRFLGARGTAPAPGP